MADSYIAADRMSEELGRFIDDEREESVLVERAQKGDRKAFDDLVRRCDRYVLAFALSASGDRRAARAAYVRTFVEAYRSVRRIPPGMTFRSWACGIVRRITSGARPRQI